VSKRAKYHQVVEGEWTAIPKRGHWNMCCACALVHIIDYRLNDGALEMRVRVDRRATAAARRPFKFKSDGDE
jgi:hypothetical protein